MQVPVFLISLVMIGHAFWGPQLAPKNLAALLTWVHFRGLVVLVILLFLPVFLLAALLPGKRKDLLIWGPEPGIDNKYWSQAMKEVGWKRIGATGISASRDDGIESGPMPRTTLASSPS